MQNQLNTKQRLQALGKYISEHQNPKGYWDGKLSSSALGVAVAIVALHFYNAEKYNNRIHKALQWLENNINTDGGYGDSPESNSNVSTSLLVYAAINLYAGKYGFIPLLQQKLANYLSGFNIDVQSHDVSNFILDHYKKDFTFSVPILALCGVCNVPGPDAFKKVPQLPFELSLLPRAFYRFLNLTVVSYAIPALVAVGILIFSKKKSGFMLRFIRKFSVPFALKKLEKSLPESGGYLEAIPLTAFVALSLINSGYSSHLVVKKGIGFLENTQRADGSWPIDVDLSTWVSSLSVKAYRNNINTFLSNAQQRMIKTHFLALQNKTKHPFNGTPPGGWGWTTFSGSVPDGDDTPGAMLALMQLGKDATTEKSIAMGVNWLNQLQNNDGGFPTFSKGWGKLPFDQSCNDLTGHAVLALTKSIGYLPTGCKEQKLAKKMVGKAIYYLQKHQGKHGEWLPLWFGNQQDENHENPVYGTARVATYLKDALLLKNLPETIEKNISNMVFKAQQFLITAQNTDGSWGGNKAIEGSIEETALAVSALISEEHKETCKKGLHWLDSYYIENGLRPSPIGLYFASLWYSEQWYPVTAYMEALTRWEEL
jgi:squalene-hopene/tetraprenyl-beta-curcumene cyclase